MYSNSKKVSVIAFVFTMMFIVEKSNGQSFKATFKCGGEKVNILSMHYALKPQNRVQPDTTGKLEGMIVIDATSAVVPGPKESVRSNSKPKRN